MNIYEEEIMVLLDINWDGVIMSLTDFWLPTIVWIVVIVGVILLIKGIIKKKNDK